MVNRLSHFFGICDDGCQATHRCLHTHFVTPAPHFNTMLLLTQILFAQAAECPEQKINRVGKVQAGSINEVSGIAIGKGGRIWVHNDSGDEPNLYALAADGELLFRTTLLGAEAYDWEDMGIHRGERGSTLYIGDIGDNFSLRRQVVIYMAREPTKAQQDTPIEGSFTADYGDVGSQDAESLAIDPSTGAIYILTKGRSGKLHLMEKKSPHRIGEHATFNRVMTFDIPAAKNDSAFQATGMDISSDGRMLAWRNYDTAMLWTRSNEEEWAKALERPPCRIRLPEQPQGESLAFSEDGKSLWTISENKNQPVYRIDLSFDRSPDP
jgi:hypothetical protein